jgi:hypothetical protein
MTKNEYLEALKQAAEQADDEVLDELLLELVDGALLGESRDRVPLLERLVK